MQQFFCPYLGGNVELTEEREQHITETHPDLFPQYFPQLIQMLADPDQVRRSVRMDKALLIARRFDDIRDGKYIVVVVVTADAPESHNWIITAYIARKLTGGILE